MNALKYVVTSLALCLAITTVLSAKHMVKINLVPENRSIKYQYALVADDESTDDESAILDPAKLKYANVKKGVTLTFDSDKPSHLYIKEQGSSKMPVGFPLQTVRDGIENGSVDRLLIRSGGFIGLGYKPTKQPKSKM